MRTFHLDTQRIVQMDIADHISNYGAKTPADIDVDDIIDDVIHHHIEYLEMHGKDESKQEDMNDRREDIGKIKDLRLYILEQASNAVYPDAE